jgi:hypothetical protein
MPPGAMTGAARPGLPAYTGPGGRCPKCQVPCASATEWHWAAVAFPSREQQRGRAPACGELGLLGIPVDGEHLCRLCTNCGYGWAEACPAPPSAPPRVAVSPPAPAPPRPKVPSLAVLPFSLVVSLVGTGAGSVLSPRLSGAALVAAWLAVAAAMTVVIVVGHLATAGWAGSGSSR